MPKRICRKGYYEPIPKNAVLVARPSKYGNPFALKIYKSREYVLSLYREWLNQKLKNNPYFLDSLKDKDLVCYCKLSEKCHADILLEKLKELGINDN